MAQLHSSQTGMKMRRGSSPEDGAELCISALFEGPPTEPLTCLRLRISKMGGWVLKQESRTCETASVIFEFEAGLSLRVYEALVESVLHLSKSSHLQLSRLCTCALHSDLFSHSVCRIELQVVCIPLATSELPARVASGDLATAA
jgi:hypothetical protein